MARIRGCMDILGGIMNIQISRWPLPQRQGNIWPQHTRVRRFEGLVRGSALIMRGISRGLLPNPEGRTARELEHVATRMNGWLGIFGGCASLWFVLRGPQRWPVPVEDQSVKRQLQVVGVVSGIGRLMHGVADGVMIYPPGWKARLLRRAGSGLAFVSAVLWFAPLVIGILRENRHHGRQGSTRLPEVQQGKRGEVAMDDWPMGQMRRTTRHRYLLLEVSGTLPVAFGVFNLEQGLFKVTHKLGTQPPQIGEQLSLLQGYRDGDPEFAVQITGITHDTKDADQVIYTFRPE